MRDLSFPIFRIAVGLLTPPSMNVSVTFAGDIPVGWAQAKGASIKLLCAARRRFSVWVKARRAM